MLCNRIVAFYGILKVKGTSLEIKGKGLDMSGNRGSNNQRRQI
ncbi:hypothetical protein MNV_590002 [Candidatus Methanoperedens nitroreducens]|uniref:Uncharacterized protein n=1 Tax=Candidatus Methanoperedens nitratireducens TaxID=1392998 RepID=A0A284VS80_9EURY|nr:hypothetical protein MNV_590002 [Candidatus Methanoperedens nitroreducens]